MLYLNNCKNNLGDLCNQDDYEQSIEFLKRAGYNFVPRNRRETIIAYVMRNQRYTFSQMEEVLYLFNEKTFLES